jgi:cytochrome c biogenesis protein CcmG/thiol:disulfide interchange protein DsbE
MTRSRMTTALAAVIAVIGLSACGSDAGNPDSAISSEEATQPLEGASPQLTAIRDDANELIPGGEEAFRKRLAELRGTPVVVNKWASWCGPCRLEFPLFQEQASKRGGEIAFLGVDSDDGDGAAMTFLDDLPLPYPSYSDPDEKIADLIEAPRNFPATAFYDRTGKLAFTHQGPYTSEESLAADIQQFAR